MRTKAGVRNVIGHVRIAEYTLPYTSGRCPRLRSLGRALVAFYLGQRIPPVTAVALYIDDSVEGPIHVLAGYVAHEEAWDKTFAPAWRELIARAPHKISEFKASDCRIGAEEFHPDRGWTPEERTAFYKDAVGVVADACAPEAMIGFGSAIVYPGRALRPKDRRVFERAGFEITFVQLIADALNASSAFVAQTNEPDDLVRLIYDEKKKFVHLVNEHFEAVRAHLGERGARLRWPVPDSSAAVPALQAADLLAYETYKEVRNQLEVPTVRPPSKALARLIDARHHRAHCGDFTHMYEADRMKREGIPTDDFRLPKLFESGRPLRGAGLWLPPQPPWERPYYEDERGLHA